MKICYKCGEERNESEFHKDKKFKDGLSRRCKLCVKQYQNENRDHILKKQREYNSLPIRKEKRIRDKEKIRIRAKAYYEKNRGKVIEYSKNYHAKNIDKRRAYYSNNSNKISEYRKKNSKKRADQCKEYRKRNPNRVIEYEKMYSVKRKSTMKIRRKTDLLFRLKENLRSRIYKAIKSRGYIKNGNTHKMLGESCEFIRDRLESMFSEGMDWGNYGDWHIDHIIPLASAKNEEDMIRLCHYSNLQPLWKLENLIKSKKVA
jgi:hypothetical protein